MFVSVAATTEFVRYADKVAPVSDALFDDGLGWTGVMACSSLLIHSDASTGQYGLWTA